MNLSQVWWEDLTARAPRHPAQTWGQIPPSSSGSQNTAPESPLGPPGLPSLELGSQPPHLLGARRPPASPARPWAREAAAVRTARPRPAEVAGTRPARAARAPIGWEGRQSLPPATSLGRPEQPLVTWAGPLDSNRSDSGAGAPPQLRPCGRGSRLDAPPLPAQRRGSQNSVFSGPSQPSELMKLPPRSGQPRCLSERMSPGQRGA